MPRRLFLFAAAAGVLAAAQGCGPAAHAATLPAAGSPQTAPASRPSSRPAPVSITMAELQRMLKQQITVEQVVQRLGQPVSKFEKSYGIMWYYLPDRETLTFHFKGRYISSVQWEQTWLTVGPTQDVRD